MRGLGKILKSLALLCYALGTLNLMLVVVPIPMTKDYWAILHTPERPVESRAKHIYLYYGVAFTFLAGAYVVEQLVGRGATMRVSQTRWQRAQRQEKAEWSSSAGVVTAEWREAQKKFGDLFETIESNYFPVPKPAILDIGCGPTCISRLFRKGSKTGVDPLANALHFEGGVGDVLVQTGEAESLVFEEASFDVVVCINALDHMREPTKALSEMYRVLRPEGLLVLGLYVYPPFIKLVRDIAEFTGIKRNIGHPHVFSEKSIVAKLCTHFELIDAVTVYTGGSPTDYGKGVTIKDQHPVLTKLVMFVNYKLLRGNYFVKEVVFLGKKLD